MYFESSYKCNDNGKITGFHKKGKYEDGKITYFINDRYGDALPQSLPPELEAEAKDVSAPVIHTSIDNVIPTIPSPSNLHKLSDAELINTCESLTTNNIYKLRHRDIKNKLRTYIHNQLNNHKCVNENLLNDFKFAVAHCDDDPSTLSEEDKNHWETLHKCDFRDYK